MNLNRSITSSVYVVSNNKVLLHNPMHTLLENVGHEVENIEFIYFARGLSNRRPYSKRSIIYD